MVGTHTEFPSTDFAITSVNVPDRLDLREVDDRKQQDEESHYARASIGSALRMWSRRFLPYLVLAAVLGLGGTWLANERETLKESRVAQRLSAVLHIPVTIQDSHLRTTPAPGLVLTGVDLGGQVRLGEIVLEFTAPNLWQAVMSGRRRWGDVVISSSTLNLDQANQMLKWLGSLSQLVPDSVTRVRFAQVRFIGTGLLPDRYEASTRRESTGQFTTVTLRRLDTSTATMQLQITPDPAGGPSSFQCDASEWQPPFTPKTAWSEFIASGHISGTGVEIEKFTLGSAFGAVEGQLSVRRQQQGSPAWVATGQLSTVGIDIATVIQQVAIPPKPAGDIAAAEPAAVFNAPMAGAAAIEAVMAGGGATPEDALASLVAEGQIKVRSAELNGINLGYAASRPSANSVGTGASTRFTHFESSFAAGSSGVRFSKINGLAGALSTHGEIAVSPDLRLDGLLHVDLGGSRIQAPLRIHVRGTVAHPEFGR
jgi:hypothetical protein